MKCLQIVDSDTISGLPVNYEAVRPYVLIGHKRAFLSNALLETNPGPRVLRCDIRIIDDGNAELLPEAVDATMGDAEPSAVLVSLTTYVGEYEPVVSVSDMLAGAGKSEVLLSGNRYRYSDGGYVIYRSLLAVMYPGSSMEIQTARPIPLPKDNWLKILRRRSRGLIYSSAELVRHLVCGDLIAGENLP